MDIPTPQTVTDPFMQVTFMNCENPVNILEIVQRYWNVIITT